MIFKICYRRKTRNPQLFNGFSHWKYPQYSLVSRECDANVTIIIKRKRQGQCGYTSMSRNKQSRKYLIGRSYKNDEFNWPFDLGTVNIQISMLAGHTQVQVNSH